LYTITRWACLNRSRSMKNLLLNIDQRSKRNERNWSHQVHLYNQYTIEVNKISVDHTGPRNDKIHKLLIILFTNFISHHLCHHFIFMFFVFVVKYLYAYSSSWLADTVMAMLINSITFSVLLSWNIPQCRTLCFLNMSIKGLLNSSWSFYNLAEYCLNFVTKFFFFFLFYNVWLPQNT